jgi:hypothetical protein
MKEGCARIERDFFWCRQKSCSPFYQTYWKSGVYMSKWDMSECSVIASSELVIYLPLGLCSTLCIAYIPYHNFRILKFPFLQCKFVIYFFFIFLQCDLISAKRIKFSFRNSIYTSNLKPSIFQQNEYRADCKSNHSHPISRHNLL